MCVCVYVCVGRGGCLGYVLAVGDDATDHGGTVVSAEADKEDAGLGDVALGEELVGPLPGLDDARAVLVAGDLGVVIRVLCMDRLVCVRHVLRLDLERNRVRGRRSSHCKNEFAERGVPQV